MVYILQLRFEKRESEVEHIRKEHERDLEVEALTKEKTDLKQANSELEAKIQVQTEESAKDKAEISKLEARLFHRYYLQNICIFLNFSQFFPEFFLIFILNGSEFFLIFSQKSRSRTIGKERRFEKND